MGRLTRDPELSYTQNQTPICKISIAVGKKYKKQDGSEVDEVSFFDAVSFGKTATAISQYFKKGQRILINGELKQSRYQDNAGANKSHVNINIRGFDFIEPSGNGTNSQSTSPNQQLANDPNTGSNIEFKNFDQNHLGDDEVPF